MIELLAVILIIGVLSAITIVSLNSSRAKARDAKRLADVRKIRDGLAVYYANNYSFPPQTTIFSSENPIDSPNRYCLQSGQGFVQVPCNPANGTIIMNYIPLPPTPADGFCASTNTQGFENANGEISRNYYYYIRDRDTYKMEFCLSSPVEGLSAGMHTVYEGEIK